MPIRKHRVSTLPHHHVSRVISKCRKTRTQDIVPTRQPRSGHIQVHPLRTWLIYSNVLAYADCDLLHFLASLIRQKQVSSPCCTITWHWQSSLSQHAPIQMLLSLPLLARRTHSTTMELTSQLGSLALLKHKGTTLFQESKNSFLVASHSTSVLFY